MIFFLTGPILPISLLIENDEEREKYKEKCEDLEEKFQKFVQNTKYKQKSIVEKAESSKLLKEIEIYVNEIKQRIIFLEMRRENLKEIKYNFIKILDDEHKIDLLKKLNEKRERLLEKILEYKRVIHEYELLDKNNYRELKNFKEKLEKILKI